MNAPTAGPRCPRCRRPLAAWRLNHCVYCGESFPAELKEGFTEPEALKWIERPALPVDLSKKLEMMKVIPQDTARKSPSLVRIAGILSIPIFAAVFYLTWTLIKQLSPASGFLIGLAGVGVVGYLVWTVWKSRR